MTSTGKPASSETLWRTDKTPFWLKPFNGFLDDALQLMTFMGWKPEWYLTWYQRVEGTESDGQ